MAPGKGRPLVASNGGPPPPVASGERRKTKTSPVLDGLISDLSRKVAAPFEVAAAGGHLEGIRTILRCLSQIQKLERPAHLPPAGQDAETRLKALEQWLLEQGVELDGLRLAANLPEGCGVVAERAFDKADLIITVPKLAMMTTAFATRLTEDVSILARADPIVRAFPSLVLTLHLLFEKHRPAEDPSQWAGYIHSLPGQAMLSETNADTGDNFIMPLAFSMETIEALQGTYVLGEIHKTLRNFARQYTHVRNLLKLLAPRYPVFERALSWFTWAEFRWAASTVAFRQNEIPPPSGERTCLALIPVFDMFNHEEGESSADFRIELQGMELFAKRRFEAGEQVFMSYGSRPTSQLLVYGGFVPVTNSSDMLKLTVELEPTDPLLSKKLALLKWLELPASGPLDLFHDGTPSKQLATWLQVAAMTEISAVNDALRTVIATRTKEAAKAMEDQRVVQEAAQAKARTNGHIASIHVGRGGSASTLAAGKAVQPLSAAAGLGIGSLSANSRSKSGQKDGVAAVAVSAQPSANGSISGKLGSSVQGKDGTVNGLQANGRSEAAASVAAIEERESKKEDCSRKDGDATKADGKKVEGESRQPHEEAGSDEGSWDVDRGSKKETGSISLPLDQRGVSYLARICQKRLHEYPPAFDDKLSTSTGVGKAHPPKEEITMAVRARAHEVAILQRAVERGAPVP